MYLHEIADMAINKVFLTLDLSNTDDVNKWEEFEENSFILKNSFVSKNHDEIFFYSVATNNLRYFVDVEILLNFSFPADQLLQTLILVNKMNEEFNSYGVYLDKDKSCLLIRSSISFSGYSAEDVFENFKYAPMQECALYNLLIDMFMAISKIRTYFPFNTKPSLK